MVTKVTTDVIDDGDVTTAKLADGALSADATGRAKMADGFVTGAKLATSGMAAQLVYAQTGDITSGTTTIPSDDTIPQSTEGTQFMSQQITPTNAANYLLIEVVAVLTASAAVNVTMALFKDAGADAIAAVLKSVHAADQIHVVTLTHRILAGSTSQQEFKVRVGGSGASTIRMNGFSGGRIFGGVCVSSIKITEVKP